MPAAPRAISSVTCRGAALPPSRERRLRLLDLRRRRLAAELRARSGRDELPVGRILVLLRLARARMRARRAIVRAGLRHAEALLLARRVGRISDALGGTKRDEARERGADQIL